MKCQTVFHSSAPSIWCLFHPESWGLQWWSWLWNTSPHWYPSAGMGAFRMVFWAVFAWNYQLSVPFPMPKGGVDKDSGMVLWTSFEILLFLLFLWCASQNSLHLFGTQECCQQSSVCRTAAARAASVGQRCPRWDWQSPPLLPAWRPGCVLPFSVEPCQSVSQLLRGLVDADGGEDAFV